MSNEETLDSLSKEIEVLRREIKTQKSNLFQLGIIVMVLVTIVYLMMTPTILAVTHTFTNELSFLSVPSVILGLVWIILPLFICAGFFIVNEFKK